MKSPRILIVRLSALGDVLHALPLLGALREHFPQAHLGWLVQKGGAQLLDGHPLLDRLHLLPRGNNGTLAAFRALRKELKAENYECAIDVQGLFKSAIWPQLAGIPRRIGFGGQAAREFSGIFYTDHVRPDPRRRHIIERNMALLGPLQIEPAPQIVTPVHLPAAARARARAIVGEDPATAPLFVFCPGAGWKTKMWEPWKYGELATRLVNRYGARVAFCWGPGEQPLVRDAMLRSAGAPEPDFAAEILPIARGIYALPATTFIELGAVIEQARLFVGGDTGPTHFAAALGVPTVSMMGPLDARRNGPYGARSITIQHAVPRAAPFGKNHKEWCDPATSLEWITVEEIEAASNALLSEST